ncbi:MAG TPA: NAD(P)-dependent oxidoreductase [Candidatus Acidoferrum sp.]|nr:NAD(P)-dependent oxidoreductase [Candidatus Acidoferrum sp.]
MTAVGIIGLGLLGNAVASRLLAGGHDVIGYDVVPDRVADVVRLGGRGAASAAEAGSPDVVCVILPSLASVEEVILGADGLVARGRPGQTIVQMSTISPTLTRRLAREVAAGGPGGLSFLDCPISGTSGMVAQGHGVIFVGGERAAFERWRDVLGAVLPRPVYVGDAGQAMVLKLIANLLVALHSAAAAEALAMARRAGLDLDLVLEVLGNGAAGSRMLTVRGPLIVKDEFPAQMKLDLFMKDLHLIQDAARDIGTPLPLTDVAERLYAAVHAAGHGAEDLAVVVKAL